ncbi:zinc-type alcohol dehydrogenase-like protein C1773.06c [Maniola jurtina]|uniref:zinc-type alcohol dehydrogenase-like protein C1773.06c n=1 Tax=Maniola jurtina TaxID=191418 RepID=UPI001E687B79|nr:zinc-type alcohol dehydrogenase-like protein C1773.06c [Maniola jurtina]XP_045784120.1 zinc-type alcohol dehydrogenase-like protein C1773.06c [Maniola jurtina]XP_045784121.1 zinc-type alcohol dehydrogenase-like protein C1773.06c [Maniola jurtina]
MSKLCRQVSIESPGPTLKECVFSFDVPVPDVPLYGARIRVAYAGACYRVSRTRSASVCSTSSVSSIGSLTGEMESFGMHNSAPAQYIGLRDGALFPGYEVAGIVDAIGSAAECTDGITVGTRIVLYPYEGVPHGYADYIVVPDFKCLVPVPAELPLSIAAMLPTGALLATNTVCTATECLNSILEGTNRKDRVTMLIVGTGGLALWALRIATHYFGQLPYHDRIHISVASLKDEGFVLAKENEEIKVVQWSEDLYERQLIERTIDACGGPVDVVLNFGTTSRSLHRSLQCLAPGGMVLVTEDIGEKLLPKFAKKAEDMNVNIVVVPNGTIEQLKELVELVANGEIEPPPHSVFPVEEAQEVVRKLCNSEINGRAILKFYNVD